MDEYISRQAVFDAFNELDYDISSNQTFDNLYGHYGFSEETVNRTIGNIPAADVRPVVRGHWIPKYEEIYRKENIFEHKLFPDYFVCSICGRAEIKQEPFCNCGAYMREETK